MNVRELREIYFKSRRWQPVVAAIINYLSNVDYRLASLSHKVSEIDIEKIYELESAVRDNTDAIGATNNRITIDEERISDNHTDIANLTDTVSGLSFKVNNVIDNDIVALSDRTDALSDTVEEIESDLEGVDLSQIATNKANIENLDSNLEHLDSSVADLSDDVADLQTAITAIDPDAISKLEKQMQGAYVRFSGNSIQTPNTSPYRVILDIDMNNCKVYDDDILLVTAQSASRAMFKVAGKVEIYLTALFQSSQPQHVALQRNATPSASNYVAYSYATSRNPALKAVFDVSSMDSIYFFGGGQTNTVRTITGTSPMTYARIRYIEKS